MNKIENVGFVIKAHAPEIKRILSDLIAYFDEKKILNIGHLLEQEINIYRKLPHITDQGN